MLKLSMPSTHYLFIRRGTMITDRYLFETPLASNRGKAEIWVDGVKAATLDLYSPTLGLRQVVWAKIWPLSGTHKVEIRVLGAQNTSSTDKRVDIDGFTVIR